MGNTPIVQPTPDQPYQPPVGTGPVESPIAGGPVSTPPPPSTPATAPASTLPPSKTSGVHGVLANVALGALAGAVTGIKKTASTAGRGYSRYMNSTPYGLGIQQEKQKLEAEKQKMQQEQVAAMDEHQIKQLTLQDMSMDHLHKIAENLHLEKMYGGEEEAQRLGLQQERNTLMDHVRVQNDADRKLLSQLDEMGLHISYKQLRQFTPSDATNVGKGNQTVINNGKTGDEAGGGFISNQELESFILPHDMDVIHDWLIDKDGNMTPVMQHLKKGENNALDAVIAHDAGMDKFNELQAMYGKQLADKKEQAAAKLAGAQATEAQAGAEEKRAAAHLNEAYVKQLGGGAGPGGTPLPAVADAVSKLPPQVQKDLQSFSPAIQGLLVRGAYGWIDPNTFPQRLTKGGIGITRAQATGIMNEINPNFSDSLYNNIKKVQADYVTGKEGQSIRSFNQFLVHAQELKHVSDNFARTQSPWINQPLNTVKAKGMGDPGVPEMMTAVEAARQEWTTFINSGYKPDEDTQKRADILMSDKSTPGMIMGVLGVMGNQAVGRLDQLNESYKTATGQDYPNLVTPSGRQAAQELGINVGSYQSGGSYGGGAGQTTPQIPVGARPVIVNGKTIGYTTDGKNMTRF